MSETILQPTPIHCVCLSILSSTNTDRQNCKSHHSSKSEAIIMGGNRGPIVSATASIPFAYRLMLTTIEPLFALSGALMAFRKPEDYLSNMTRNSASFTPNTAFLYTELAGAWLYFAFTEAVVLRLFDDLRLWRLLCIGMLLSDAAYCHSVAQAVGGWGVWLAIGDWPMEDWLVFLATAPPLLVRLLIVFGIGVKRG
jgi:hypothetical protein